MHDFNESPLKVNKTQFAILHTCYFEVFKEERRQINKQISLLNEWIYSF